MLIPGDSPFDWNGWGVGVHPVESEAAAKIRIPEWREGVEAIVDSALADAPLAMDAEKSAA